MSQYTKRIYTALLLGLTTLQAVAQQVTPPSANTPGIFTPPSGSVTYPGLYDLTQPTIFNYVRSSTPDVPSATPMTNYVRRTTTYFDGLGRPLQTVANRALGDYTDLVQHHVYDSLGRESYQYLPYIYDLTGTVVSVSAGSFHREAKSNLAQFYAGSPGEQPYSKTEFENSALGRPVKQLAPGKSWIGTGRGATTGYGTNAPWVYTNPNLTGTAITTGYPRWTIALTAGAIPQYQGDYASGELYRTTAKDEDGKISESFKDKQGRVVFTRSIVSATANTANTRPVDYAYTCYVYDDLGNLRCVISPTASMTEILNSSQVGWSMDQQRLDGLCYQYTYDERNRKVEQKIPGKAWEYFVYDKRDRQVYYQDGYFRGQHKWLFTFFDILDRPTFSGTAELDVPRSQMQALTDGGPAGFLNSSIFYYSNNYDLYHAYSDTLPYCLILSYTYYDDYSQLTAGNLQYDATQFDNINLPSEGTVVASVLDNANRGRVTGSKVRVMDPENPGADNWLTSANYYDSKGRLIQSRSTNLRGGTDISSNIYYFQGMLWKNILRHENPLAKQVAGTTDGVHTTFRVATTSTCNLLQGGGTDQVKSVTMQIDDGIVYPFANYYYDHMGRVVAKQTPAAETLQEYNLRGFLNHIDMQNGNNVADSVHIFEENLYYDQGFNSKLYNGNIAGITWRKAGANAPVEAYGYSYDGLNRLNHAQYERTPVGTTNWNNTAYNYTASNITYDYNGNIKSMDQMGPTATTPAAMDQLTYNYAANSNQLIKVEDGVAPATTTALGLPDFKNNANTATEYTYDPNGNMVTDDNKKITSITYNYLNKPEVITVQNQGTLTYTYDAAGNRLRKKVHTNATNTDDIYYYIGNFVYKNDSLQYMLTSEGRARPVANDAGLTKFVYDYFTKDHLGNVRSTVTAEPMDYAYLAGMEISQANVEQLVFENIPNVRDGKPGGGPNDHMAARLNAGEPDRKIGTAIMLHAMPGDKFTISADAYYEGDYYQTDVVGSDAIISSLAGALMGGSNYDGVPLSELPDNVRTIEQVLGNPDLATTLDALVATTNNPEAPKAHLNILFFNKDMQLVPSASHIIQVQPGGIAGNGGWQVLTPWGNNPGNGGTSICCIMPEGGTVIVYVDNQSVGKDVFFDNIFIDHFKGKVQEESHYYPFGLTLQTDVQTPEITKQPFKLTTKELEQSFDLNTYDFDARTYDMTGPRWGQIDPLAEKYYSVSPYAYCMNNPVLFKDPDGNQIAVTTTKGADGKEAITITLTGKIINESGKEYTAEQMQTFADRLTAAISSSFSGKDGDVTWNTVVNLTVATNEDQVSETDHAFRIMDRTDVPNNEGGLNGTATGSALGGGKDIYLSGDITDKKPATEGKYAGTGKTSDGYATLEHTGSHEFGHSAGENHPEKGTANENVMHQTVQPNAGLKTTKNQIYNIRKAFKDGRLNLNYEKPVKKGKG